MAYKDPEAQREFQKLYKRALRRSLSHRRKLHVELGIKTFTHMQAVLHAPGGRFSRGIKGEQVNAHWYRMPITLAKVWA